MDAKLQLVPQQGKREAALGEELETAVKRRALVGTQHNSHEARCLFNRNVVPDGCAISLVGDVRSAIVVLPPFKLLGVHGSEKRSWRLELKLQQIDNVKNSFQMFSCR